MHTKSPLTTVAAVAAASPIIGFSLNDLLNVHHEKPVNQADFALGEA